MFFLSKYSRKVKTGCVQSLQMLFYATVTKTLCRNKIQSHQTQNICITFRRLGAKGSYLTLVRVADRIL